MAKLVVVGGHWFNPDCVAGIFPVPPKHAGDPAMALVHLSQGVSITLGMLPDDAAKSLNGTRR